MTTAPQTWTRHRSWVKGIVDDYSIVNTANKQKGFVWKTETGWSYQIVSPMTVFDIKSTDTLTKALKIVEREIGLELT